MRQPLNDLGTPALRALPLQNIPPNLPLQQHQLTVNGQWCPLLRSVDAQLRLYKPLGVAARRLN